MSMLSFSRRLGVASPSTLLEVKLGHLRTCLAAIAQAAATFFLPNGLKFEVAYSIATTISSHLLRTNYYLRRGSHHASPPPKNIQLPQMNPPPTTILKIHQTAILYRPKSSHPSWPSLQRLASTSSDLP